MEQEIAPEKIAEALRASEILEAEIPTAIGDVFNLTKALGGRDLTAAREQFFID